MPTNQQRRDAAKRKLERQLVHRQEQLKSRRQRTIIGSVLAVVLLTVGIIWFVTADRSDSAADGASTSETDTATETTPATPCSYPASSDPAVKDVAAPTNTNPAQTGQVEVTITLGQGPITATLDRGLAPCAVNAFVSLAAQKFYDNTDCHRLTASETFKILQCGDPSGTGRGGPGFTVSNESSIPAQMTPEELTAAAQTVPPTPAPLHYPVGTLAMASTVPGGSNGSQFFIVYDTTIIDSPSYTKIGSVNAASLAVIQGIAVKGTAAGPNGLKDAPAEKVTISSVTVPAEAAASQAPSTSTPSDEPTATATDSPATDTPTTTGDGTPPATTPSAAGTS